MTTTDRTAALYAAAAARIGADAFAALNRPPVVAENLGAMFVGAVRIAFTPGDGTTYNVLLARSGEAEIDVAVIGGGCATFAFDGLYLDPAYVQLKMLGALRVLDAYAIAAIIGRAYDAVAETRERYESVRERMAARLDGGPSAVVVVIDESD